VTAILSSCTAKHTLTRIVGGFQGPPPRPLDTLSRQTINSDRSGYMAAIRVIASRAREQPSCTGASVTGTERGSIA